MLRVSKYLEDCIYVDSLINHLKHNFMKNILLAIVCLFLISCSNKNNHVYDWEREKEIRDSVNKAKEDSIILSKKLRRDSINAIMTKTDHRQVVGGIKLGQTSQEYSAALKNIRRSVGYVGVKFDDVVFDIENPKFLHGELYSVEMRYSYLYKPYRRVYNDIPSFNPTSFINPIIHHFEDKYGVPDYEKEYWSEIRGYEKALNCNVRWDFPKKRITIINEAAKHSKDAECATYTLKILFENPAISDKLYEIEKKKKEIEEERRLKRRKEIEKAEDNLLNTI